DIQERVNFGSFGPVSTRPAAYVPASQFGDGAFRLAHGWFEPSWIVRTDRPMPTMASVLQQSLRDVDPQVPFNKLRTLDDVRGEAIVVARLQAALLGTFAGIALLLCALGVGGM